MPIIFGSGQNFNPAALQVPDIYVEVFNPPSYLKGVPTDVCGVVGTASWGPKNTPTLLGSTNDLYQNFGPITAAALTDQHDLPTDITLAFNQAQGSTGSVEIWAVRVTDGTDTAASVVLNDTTLPTPNHGITLTAIYTGSLGSQISVVVANGIKTNTYTVSVLGFQGNVSEIYPNIAGTGSAFWTNLLNAINNGINGFRGPSQLVIASNASGTAVAPALGTFPLAGGADGRSVTTSELVGQNTAFPYTGLFALQDQTPAVGVAWISGLTDTTAYSTVQTFCDGEACVGLLTFPTGTSTTSAISTKNSVGIDDPNIVFVKDWVYILDTFNQTTRLVAPMSVVGGRIAALAPQFSTTNKQVFGITGTERVNPTTGTTPYSRAEIGQLTASGITFLYNPVPGGNYFGFRNGVNSSSDPVRSYVEYARMTNFLARSLENFMGQFIGLNQSVQPNDPTRAQAKQVVDTFLQLLQINDQIDSYLSVCDLSNNTPTTIAQHYLFMNVYVRYLSSIQYFIVALTGGTTTVTVVNNPSNAPTF